MSKLLSRLLLAAVTAASVAASAPALAQKVRLATSAGDIVIELEPPRHRRRSRTS